jgi:hypothetical protein
MRAALIEVWRALRLVIRLPRLPAAARYAPDALRSTPDLAAQSSLGWLISAAEPAIPYGNGHDPGHRAEGFGGGRLAAPEGLAR